MKRDVTVRPPNPLVLVRDADAFDFRDGAAGNRLRRPGAASPLGRSRNLMAQPVSHLVNAMRPRRSRLSTVS